MILTIFAVIFELLITLSIKTPDLANSISSTPAGLFQGNRCSECHDDISIDVSVHEGFDCIDCHELIDTVPHEEISIGVVDCSSCHSDVSEIFLKSVHGTSEFENSQYSTECRDCHGDHGILSVSDEDSRMHPNNQAVECGKCHADPEIADEFDFLIKNPIELYEKSVHAYQISQGNYNAATCSDCHGSHNIRMLNDPLSKIFDENVPETCSKCHKEEYAEYIESEHWKAYSKGIKQAPLCIDCHLEHAILSPHDPESPVSPTKVPATCSYCHANERIINRYGLATFRVESFMSSYHGLAMRRGAEDVANCVSCHGVHKILSEKDPESMINPANLNSTCGKCHPGFNDGITIGKIHVSTDIEPLAPVIWVRIIYLWIIVITVSGMVIHNGLDFLKKVKSQSYIRFRSLEFHEKFVIRFNLVERAIHWSVMISFILLAWTGFSLAYPESSFGIFWSENLRRLIHRISGVIMTMSIVIQSLLMIFTKRGRYQLREFFPKLRDAKDLIRSMAFYLGIARNGPKFGRYSYIEKVEFWAFMWGSIIMGITGVALWFETVTLRIFPSWSIEFFTAIHFYEAILASLAIVVWHFYWVIFDPDIYPGTGANLHGKISLERLKAEYPKEYEKISVQQIDK